MLSFFGRARAILWSALLGGVLLSLIPLLDDGSTGWSLPEQLRLQIVIGLCVVTLMALLVRTPACAGIALLAVAGNLAVVMPHSGWWTGEETTRAERGDDTTGSLRIVHFNTMVGNRRIPEAARVIAGYRPDVVALLESDSDWPRSLAAAGLELPHATPCCWVHLRSRHNLTEFRPPFRDSGDPISARAAKLSTPVGPVTVVSVHFPQPPPFRALDRQRKQFEVVAEAVAKLRAPVILAADFNAVPWAGTVERFAARSGLRRVPTGITPTWGPRAIGLGLPIDHVFVSADLDVVHAEIIDPGGSDHRAVLVDLRLPRSAGAGG